MSVYHSLFYLGLVLVSMVTTVVPLHLGDGILKALPALFLAVCAWFFTRSRFGWWVSVGVLLGAMGDYSLANAERSWFMAGVITFLIGHIAYSVAFAKDLKRTRVRELIILLTISMMTLLVITVSFRMVHVGEQGLIVPVSVYAAVMCIMMAIAVLHQSPTKLIAAGGIIFVLSDAHIALNHMLLSSPRLALALSGYATYYLAQYCLVAGAACEAGHKEHGESL